MANEKYVSKFHINNEDYYLAPHPTGGVTSVNGAKGNVVLTIPSDTSELTNGAAFVNSSEAAAAAPVLSINGQTGNVTLNIPTLITELVNNAGYLNRIAAVNLLYPIGSIYLSVSPTSPELLFGGTWQRILDTFLLAAGSTYTAGSNGGEAEHTLTINEIPSHNHSLSTDLYIVRDRFGSGERDATGDYSGYGTQYTVGKTGGGLAHNNMPPYLAVYVWKRIS